jgi:hypothetical protein
MSDKPPVFVGGNMSAKHNDISLAECLKSQQGFKYADWAVHLDKETLSALFWALGEFGYRAASANASNWISIHIGPDVRVKSGGWPTGRIKVAIEAITAIVSGEKMTVSDLWDRILASRHPAPAGPA